MRRLLQTLTLSALCLISSAPVWAENPVLIENPAQAENPALPENIVGNYAVLRALDKVSAATEDFTVKVGDTLDYGSLSIDVKYCEKRPPEDIPETYVFLQIFQQPLTAQKSAEKTPETGEAVDPRGEKLFSGWMLASNPAMSALDHRVYDVWVLDCRTKT